MKKTVSLLVTPREGTRFRLLLVMLFVTIALMPFGATNIGGGFLLVHVFFVLLLLSAVYAVGTTPRRLTVALLLVAGGELSFFIQGDEVAIGSALLNIAFLTYCCQQMMGYVLSTGRVTTDRLLASLCVYLLMAITFSIAYGTAYLIAPDSISGFVPETEQNPPLLAQAGYFSLVTQTTLGYGDITPSTTEAGRHVRTLAVIQAVVGQLYLTVLVARLVALHIAHVPGQDADDRGDESNA